MMSSWQFCFFEGLLEKKVVSMTQDSVELEIFKFLMHGHELESSSDYLLMSS
jgi:hypothetical protein